MEHPPHLAVRRLRTALATRKKSQCCPQIQDGTTPTGLNSWCREPVRASPRESPGRKAGDKQPRAARPWSIRPVWRCDGSVRLSPLERFPKTTTPGGSCRIWDVPLGRSPHFQKYFTPDVSYRFHDPSSASGSPGTSVAQHETAHRIPRIVQVVLDIPPSCRLGSCCGRRLHLAKEQRS